VSLEKLFYELKPFILFYLGIVAMRSPHMEAWGVFPAIALASFGLLFLTARIQYRFFNDK
jgi:hypothetical protein